MIEDIVVNEVLKNPVLFNEVYAVSRILELYRRGYRIHQDAIETPSGRILTKLDASNCLTVPLIVGYLPQIEALQVLEYFNCLENI